MIGNDAKDKDLRFARLLAEARGFGLDIREVDSTRPWGGFVRFARPSLGAFLSAYWRGIHVRHADLELDAKILLVAPDHCTSLQHHARRSEFWRVLEGPVIVSVGPNRDRLEERHVSPIHVITVPCGYVHRLGAPETGWGVVAEFWQHEDPENPSDEKDIVRCADAYGRPTNDDGSSPR